MIEPRWEFRGTVVTNGMDVGMVLLGRDIHSETFASHEVREISIINEATLVYDPGFCPIGPYRPVDYQLFPSGKGIFKGTSDAEFLTLIGSNPRIGSIAGPNPQGNICVIPFNWQQNSSTEPRAEDAHKLIPIELSKLDTKALKESIKVYEDAKIRYSDNAEVHPPGIL
jgi:hypothetical protein